MPVSPPKFTKSVPDYDPPVPEDSGESNTISQRNYQAVQVNYKVLMGIMCLPVQSVAPFV